MIGRLLDQDVDLLMNIFLLGHHHRLAVPGLLQSALELQTPQLVLNAHDDDLSNRVELLLANFLLFCLHESHEFHVLDVS